MIDLLFFYISIATAHISMFTERRFYLNRELSFIFWALYDVRFFKNKLILLT